MTEQTKKKVLVKMLMAFNHFTMDYDYYLEELSVNELIDLLDFKYRHEMGLSLRIEQIEPLRKHNRN